MQAIINFFLFISSLRICAFFIMMGSNLFFGVAVTEEWAGPMGVTVLGYGAISMILLFYVSSNPKPLLQKIVLYLSVAFFILFFIFWCWFFVSTWEERGFGGSYLSAFGIYCAGIVIVGLMLWIYWFTIKRLIMKKHKT